MWCRFILGVCMHGVGAGSQESSAEDVQVACRRGLTQCVCMYICTYVCIYVCMFDMN